MSATGRPKKDGTRTERAADDLYETPCWVTWALLGAAGLPGGEWLDPCAGRGAIIDAVRQVMNSPIGWWAIEKRSDCEEVLRLKLGEYVYIGDFLADLPSDLPYDQGRVPKEGRVDVVITNPPYSHALEFIQKCMDRWPTATLAFLLRVNFLGSQKRASWLREHTPDVYVLPKRPSFTDGGTDATEYAWMVWPHGAKERKSGRVKILEVR